MSHKRKNILQKQRLGKFTPGGLKPLMAMIEVTNRCNMTCPICYSDANHPELDVPVNKIRFYLKRLLKVTETHIPIQISGGEPSLRDNLPEIIAAETGVAADTFRSENIGHPSCNAMSPVFIVNGKLEPLFKYIRKDDLFSFLGEEHRDKILATFAGKK